MPSRSMTQACRKMSGSGSRAMLKALNGRVVGQNACDLSQAIDPPSYNSRSTGRILVGMQI
jgi:hypothetical protein